MVQDTEIDLQIKDLDNAIALLGEIYDDERDAIAEFIKNSADAKATRIDVYLQRKGKNPHIRISDDGYGMDYSELKRVARSVAYSIKKYDPQTKGEKGIGILGFQAIAERCEIVSRSTDDPGTHALILHYGKSKGTLRSDDLRVRVFPGTDVYLYRIPKTRFYRFTINKLDEYLKSKFRMDLLEESYQLWVTEGKQGRQVVAEHYRGQPFYIMDKRTIYGDIKFSLFILPTPKDVSVGLYSKGNEVISDITQLDEFNREPWNLRQVQGEITCDFCKQTTGRKGIVKDRQKYPIWAEAVKSIEKELLVEVKRISMEHKQQRDQQMYNQLRKAFARAFSELPAFSLMPKTLISSSTGGEVMGDIGGQGLGTDKKESKGERSGKKIVTLKGEKVVRAGFGIGINWIEEAFVDYPELRSRYNDKFKAIMVNIEHPDYKIETKSSQEKKIAYFCKLTAKEITLYNHPKTSPENLLEKAMELELCASRYL